MTVTANGTQDAAAVSSVAAQARLDQIASELAAQLDEAKASRELILQSLKEHDQLVERLQTAVKALSGPTPRGPYKKTAKYTGALKNPDVELMQLVEVTIARHGDEPVEMAALLDEIPGRSENTIRRVVYTLRDEGRIRVVRAQKGPHPAQYAAMPEVIAEHA